MKSSQKWILAGLFATSLSMAFADQAKDSKMMNNNNMNNNQSTGMSREITPSASPIASEGARFYFSGDFIYWQAKEDNLTVGYTGVADTYDPASGTRPSNPSKAGKIQMIDLSYEPGFKIGAGLVFAHDGWDTFMNYTWLDETNQSTTLSRTSTNGMLQSLYFNTENTASYANSVTGTWSFYFNEIDWELGRKFFISKRLVLRPHMGLKGAWIHQNYDLAEFGSTTGSLTASNANAHTYQRQKYWGVGFRTGLNAEWHFTRDFSIYGNVAVSEIYGLMHLKAKSQVDDPNTDMIATTGFVGQWINQHKNIHTMRPVLEMAMGFRYETSFGEDNYYRFLLSAGWEQQIWWNQNQFIKVPTVDTQTSNDLMFQGLDVKIGFAF